MGEFDLYRSRMVAYGGTIREGRINNTISNIKSTFVDSPSYFLAQRNGIDVNIQLVEDSQQSTKIDYIKIILMEPGTTLTLGDVFTVNTTDKWLCTSIDPLHEVYYKGMARLCNQSLTLTIGTTTVTIGYDDKGRPIQRTTDTDTYTWPCIAESKVIDANLDKPVNLPEGRINLTVSYTLPYGAIIAENIEFEMWGNKYKIIGLDKTMILNDVGVLGVLAERVVK